MRVLPLFLILDDPALVPESHDAVGYVVYDDAARPDHAPATDPDALYDRRAGTYPATLAHADAAAKGGMRGDVDIVANPALMVYAGTRVDDAVASDGGTALDDGALHHDRSLPEHCAGRDDGRRMDGRGKPYGEPSCQQLAYAVVANAYNKGRLSAESVRHGNTQQVVDRRVVVDQARNPSSSRLYDVNDHPGVAACPV